MACIDIEQQCRVHTPTQGRPLRSTLQQKWNFHLKVSFAGQPLSLCSGDNNFGGMRIFYICNRLRIGSCSDDAVDVILIFRNGEFGEFLLSVWACKQHGNHLILLGENLPDGGKLLLKFLG